jgi:hypothetical protein
MPVSMFIPPQHQSAGHWQRTGQVHGRGRGWKRRIFCGRQSWKSTMSHPLRHGEALFSTSGSTTMAGLSMDVSPGCAILAALPRGPATAADPCPQRSDHTLAPSLNDVSPPFLLAQSTFILPFQQPKPASDDHDDDVCVPEHGEDCLVHPFRAPQPASHRPAPPRPRHLDAALSRRRVSMSPLHRDGPGRDLPCGRLAPWELEKIPVPVG